VEASPVNSYHDPLTGVLELWFLEPFDVFISMRNQLGAVLLLVTL